MLNPCAHENDVPPALTNRRDWKYFDQKLTALRVNDVENIMERGRLLREAKDELEHGSFEAMVKRHFDLGTARLYRIVAAHRSSPTVVMATLCRRRCARCSS